MTDTPYDGGFFSKRNIAAMFVGSGVFVIAYLLLAMNVVNNDISALLFVALPVTSSLVVAIMTPMRKMIFRTCFASLLFNLILSPFILAEGVFCVVMAAPIFAAMTAVAAFAVWLVRRDPAEPSAPVKPPTALLLFLMAGVFAGSVWDEIALRRGAAIETVRTEVEINAARGEVWNRLTFDRPSAAKVPLWLRLWIKQPERYAFAATGVGARRETDFGEPHYGDDHDAIRNKLVYEIVEWRTNEAATFKCVENHLRMRHWLDLLDTRVELVDVGKNTKAIFTTRYRRHVGPSFYFTPFLTAAANGMHDMLGHEMGAAER